jgi:hypothetical protein
MDYKVTASKAKKILILSDGRVSILDRNGKPVPKLERYWINFSYLKKLGKIIATDKPLISGHIPPQLTQYVKYYLDNPDGKL